MRKSLQCSIIVLMLLMVSCQKHELAELQPKAPVAEKEFVMSLIIDNTEHILMGTARSYFSDLHEGKVYIFKGETAWVTLRHETECKTSFMRGYIGEDSFIAHEPGCGLFSPDVLKSTHEHVTIGMCNKGEKTIKVKVGEVR